MAINLQSGLLEVGTLGKIVEYWLVQFVVSSTSPHT